jgi:mitochondrial fission protein ELM1
MAHPRRIWILTDGKIGDLVQCRGVARHWSDAEIVERVVVPKEFWAWPIPLLPVAPSERPDHPGSPIAPPFPDLLIASGRRTVPYLRAVKAVNGETTIVFLKDPRGFGRRAADFIWAPVHDGLVEKANVIATHTSPHGITAERLAEAKGAAPIDALGDNITGVVLGGDSGAVKWDDAQSVAFAKLLAKACANQTVAITPSRRTPQVLRDAVTTALPHAYFDADGSQYVTLLASSGQIIVTGDSHNMVSEALATGAPVHVYRPQNLQPKLNGFLDAMEEVGAVKGLAAPLVQFSGVRIDATQEIAAAISHHLTQPGEG